MGTALITRRGGGAALNFKVVGGTSQPANPAENTLWVNTSTPIPGYIFSFETPGVETLTSVAVQTSKYISPDGSIQNSGNYIITDYVGLPAGAKRVTVAHGSTKSSNACHEFCDAEKNRIGLVAWQAGPTTYDVPEGAVYMRLSLYVGSAGAESKTITVAVENETVKPGAVWIKTGSASTVSFNALKKNGLEVSPLYCMQYDGAGWLAKTAKIYQAGAWFIFDKLVLFDGVSGVSLGNWTKGGSGSVTVGDSSVRLASDAYNLVWATSDYPVDVTNYNTLAVKVTDFAKDDSQSTANKIGLSATATPGNGWSEEASVSVTGVGTYTLDVSGMTGYYYVKLVNHRYSAGTTYLETNYIAFSV